MLVQLVSCLFFVERWVVDAIRTEDPFLMTVGPVFWGAFQSQTILARVQNRRFRLQRFLPRFKAQLGLKPSWAVRV